jgi:hypothetical protein
VHLVYTYSARDGNSELMSCLVFEIAFVSFTDYFGLIFGILIDAASSSPGTARVYTNGTLRSERINLNLNTASGNKVTIGARVNSNSQFTNFFVGAIHSVRIWENYAMPGDRIREFTDAGPTARIYPPRASPPFW